MGLFGKKKKVPRVEEKMSGFFQNGSRDFTLQIGLYILKEAINSGMNFVIEPYNTEGGYGLSFETYTFKTEGEWYESYWLTVSGTDLDAGDVCLIVEMTLNGVEEDNYGLSQIIIKGVKNAEAALGFRMHWTEGSNIPKEQEISEEQKTIEEQKTLVFDEEKNIESTDGNVSYKDIIMFQNEIYYVPVVRANIRNITKPYNDAEKTQKYNRAMENRWQPIADLSDSVARQLKNDGKPFDVKINTGKKIISFNGWVIERFTRKDFSLNKRTSDMSKSNIPQDEKGLWYSVEWIYCLGDDGKLYFITNEKDDDYGVTKNLWINDLIVCDWAFLPNKNIDYYLAVCSGIIGALDIVSINAENNSYQIPDEDGDTIYNYSFPYGSNVGEAAYSFGDGLETKLNALLGGCKLKNY